MKKIKRAMVLSAGLGTRLLPLTQTVPKPLLPVLNLPNITHTLFWLKEHGVEEVIFNLFHLHEKLEAFLKGFNRWGMKISLSKETVLLGTGGGVKKAESFFQNEPFILANCDFICDFDLKNEIHDFVEQKKLASMVLLEDKEKEKLYSKVGVNENGELCLLPRKKTGEPKRSGIFTGIHLLRPEALAPLKPEPCGINEILYPFFMEKEPNRVTGVFAVGVWYDTGEKKTYLESNLQLLKQMPALTKKLLEDFGYQNFHGSWMKTSLGQQFERSLIDENVSIESGKSVNCVIGRNVAITGSTSLKNCLVLPDTVVSSPQENKILSGPHVL